MYMAAAAQLPYTYIVVCTSKKHNSYDPRKGKKNKFSSFLSKPTKGKYLNICIASYGCIAKMRMRNSIYAH